MNDFQNSIAEILAEAGIITTDEHTAEDEVITTDEHTCDSCGTDIDKWCGCGMKTDVPTITDTRVMNFIEKHEDMIDEVNVSHETGVVSVHTNDGRTITLTGYVQPTANFVIQVVRRNTMEYTTYELIEQFDVPEHWSLIGTKKYASQRLLPNVMKTDAVTDAEREQFNHPVSKGKWYKRCYDGPLASYNVSGYKGTCKVQVRILDGNEGTFRS